VDLHLHGKRALVCGASRGLGYGCAEALAREGVAVTLVARRQEDLDQARAKIEALGSAPVQIVAADIATAEGRAAALAVCPTPEFWSPMRAAQSRAIFAISPARTGSPRSTPIC
jgi:Short-chain dehydrogenases of various substrate specificities